MRTLLLLRGAQGAGKTTWIEQHGLKTYTLSADDIRLLCASPSLTPDGGVEISPKNDKIVWDTLFDILERRMQNGEFTVIDATNSRTREMNKYKTLCDEYKYRIYCVDFTDVPIEVAKERNRLRDPLKVVPDAAIDKVYSRFATQKIPSGITVIKPDELDRIWFKKIDLSQYKTVHHIGDIHGCFTALMEYFKPSCDFEVDAANGVFPELNDDDFYIFTGDYIDRGIENVEVMKFLLSIYQRDNVLMLEGNHERWLWIWANDRIAASKEFELMTKTQFDNSDLDKKEMRRFYRSLGQCAYYDYNGKTVFVTHGGMSTIPDNLTKVATMQMIKGVGTYNDMDTVNDTFVKTMPENYIQIHGHRNLKHAQINMNDRCFNLEGGVEFGGRLRAVQLHQDGTHEEVEIENTVYRLPRSFTEEEAKEMQTVADAIIALRLNKYVQEKHFGDISSFSFTKKAFYDRIWDAQTQKARGLFINIPEQKVFARSYEKFFNINEREETKFDTLEYKLAFPVTAYVKENGFLGIVSYDEAHDSLFITSKSDPTGPYAGWFKDILSKKLGERGLNTLKAMVKDLKASFVFECIDIEHDPHVIEYPESTVFLLDIIKNDLKFEKHPYDHVIGCALGLDIPCKKKAYVLDNWQEFHDWYYAVKESDYLFDGRHIEGFVLEDANGFMLKLKLDYYNLWKFLRSIAHDTFRAGSINGVRTAALTTPLMNQFYGFCRGLYGQGDVQELPKDIISLRKMFFSTEAGKPFSEE